MKFNSETAGEAGRNNKRGVSAATKILNEWRDGNKEKGLQLLNTYMSLAIEGNIDAAKLILPYYFGKPKETVEIQGGEDGTSELVFRVIHTNKNEIITK